MTLLLDIPTSRPSLVGRLDVRWKLAALVPATVVCALLRTPGPALLALAGALTLVVLARLPLRWFALRVGTALVMLGFFVVWLPLAPQAHHEVLELGDLRVSITGLRLAVVLLAKTAAIVSLMLVLLATSPLHDTLKAAHGLFVPGVVIQLVLLTYRYVFLLADEFGRLRTALRVRGYRNRPGPHSYRTIGQVAGTLLVRSHERSERVAQAMRCRGFDGRFRSLHEFRATRADVVFVSLVALGLGGLLVWDRALKS